MPNTFLAADVGRDIVAASGLATITGFTSTSIITATIRQAFAATQSSTGSWQILGSPQTTCTPSAVGPVGATITLTLAAAGWRVEDVGKFVRINGGLCRITVFTTNVLVSATVQVVLSSAVAAQALAWTLEATMWGGVYGYPRCGEFYQSRLWLAGSPGFPQSFWGSIIGEYFNFQDGVLDDQALGYTLASGEYNAIAHLVEATGLLALTYGGEFSIRGGQEKPLTPTNIQVNRQSKYGACRVPPVAIAGEIYFTQRAGRKIRALAPNQFDSSKYGSPDMSVLSEHVTESGIVDMAFQQEPAGVLYAVRADGQLAALTIDRDQDVIGWTRQRTNGGYESVATIPTATGDATFLLVNRVINGVLVRYVEMFDESLHTDAALTGTSAAGSTVWTGLGHLEGRTVRVKGDGVLLASRVVIGGSITVERACKTIEVGLNYITTVIDLTPEVSGQGGSSAGANMSINQAAVRLRGTIGCTINYQQVPFKALGIEVLDQAPVPFTGLKFAGNLGWSRGNAQVIIQQTDPYPFHLLSVSKTLTINDG